MNISGKLFSRQKLCQSSDTLNVNFLTPLIISTLINFFGCSVFFPKKEHSRAKFSDCLIHLNESQLTTYQKQVPSSEHFVAFKKNENKTLIYTSESIESSLEEHIRNVHEGTKLHSQNIIPTFFSEKTFFTFSTKNENPHQNKGHQYVISSLSFLKNKCIFSVIYIHPIEDLGRRDTSIQKIDTTKITQILLNLGSSLEP